MKAIALFLILCMLTLSAVPVRAVALHTGLKKECCFKTAKQRPCKQSKNTCNGQGACTFLSCSGCGFLVISSINITPAMPIITKNAAAYYAAGNISGFSLSSWHPPKV